MFEPIVTIHTRTSIPVWDQFTGWRRLTYWLFKWPQRGRVVLTSLSGNECYCHPENLPVVEAFLQARRRDYRVVAPALRAVSNMPVRDGGEAVP